MLTSFRPGSRAIVFGSSGGIGSAFVDVLGRDTAFGVVTGLSRRSVPAIDFSDEARIADAAAHMAAEAPYALMIDATGFLAGDGIMPEKSLKQIDPAAMAEVLRVNVIGPALLLKHFHPLMPKSGRAVFASLSAKVGSIGDNRLGGWHSYRAAKAALNMVLKGASIELARRNPDTVILALHPGTVATRLSDPFSGNRDRLSPEQAALRLLSVIDASGPDRTGGFFGHDGIEIPW